ncbi:hypothetical protein L208DRAFT_1560032, partial [Tricholoma matsutake]
NRASTPEGLEGEDLFDFHHHCNALLQAQQGHPSDNSLNQQGVADAVAWATLRMKIIQLCSANISSPSANQSATQFAESISTLDQSTFKSDSFHDSMITNAQLVPLNEPLPHSLWKKIVLLTSPRYLLLWTRVTTTMMSQKILQQALPSSRKIIFLLNTTSSLKQIRFRFLMHGRMEFSSSSLTEPLSYRVTTVLLWTSFIPLLLIQLPLSILTVMPMIGMPNSHSTWMIVLSSTYFSSQNY